MQAVELENDPLWIVGPPADKTTGMWVFESVTAGEDGSSPFTFDIEPPFWRLTRFDAEGPALLPVKAWAWAEADNVIEVLGGARIGEVLQARVASVVGWRVATAMVRRLLNG